MELASVSMPCAHMLSTDDLSSTVKQVQLRKHSPVSIRLVDKLTSNVIAIAREDFRYIDEQDIQKRPGSNSAADCLHCRNLAVQAGDG